MGREGVPRPAHARAKDKESMWGKARGPGKVVQTEKRVGGDREEQREKEMGRGEKEGGEGRGGERGRGEEGEEGRAGIAKQSLLDAR